MYLVYKHTSPSGKSYIGQTCDYDIRCKNHQQKQSACRAFYAAIKKYGWDAFTHEILYDNLTADGAEWREQQAINEYSTMVPYGYNLTTGGKAHQLSPESRQRISIAHSGMKKHSLEGRADISARFRGISLTDEHKAKISAAHQNKTISEATKALLKEKGMQRRGKIAHNAKPVTIDGVTYTSKTAAGKALGCSAFVIRYRLSKAYIQ